MKINKLKFINNGFFYFRSFLNDKKCSKLLRTVYKNRNFKNIFLSEKKFYQNYKKNKSKTGLNPGPGRNLLHKLDCNFIFENEKFKKIMKLVLGDRYRILDYKLVMGMPQSKIPKWIIKRTHNYHSVNLAEYINQKFRDLTYFKGIDFHQDIIDFPDRDPDFVTAYIYLDQVNENTSPLYLIPKSHQLGADTFPHNLKFINNKVYYKVKRNKIISKTKMLSGKSGTLSIWHPFMLHGTKPHEFDKPRISVRILATKNRKSVIGCLLDQINNKIKGKKILKIRRSDLNEKGKVTKKNNMINKSL